ncbi:ATP-binding domain-containing protein [Patescibacteria group bacterium]|nr:ATP-binding domain-containing protein [Patescibacteria group bacterium]
MSDVLVGNGIMIAGAPDSALESQSEFRVVLSIFRLLSNKEDDLAWRTLLELAKNNIGEKSIDDVFRIAVDKNLRFSKSLQEIKQNIVVSKYGEKIKSFVEKVEDDLEEFNKIDNLIDKVKGVIEHYVEDTVLRERILKYFVKYISDESDTLESIVKSIGINSDRIEQSAEKDAVSILTMHKAKGLTFDVCFIVGAEDEFLPGKNEGEFIGDERRLLYVSMTRAKHGLYISYCTKRVGSQRFYGRVPRGGQEKRTLTRFLRDSKIKLIV